MDSLRPIDFVMQLRHDPIQQAQRVDHRLMRMQTTLLLLLLHRVAVTVSQVREEGRMKSGGVERGKNLSALMRHHPWRTGLNAGVTDSSSSR